MLGLIRVRSSNNIPLVLFSLPVEAVQLIIMLVNILQLLVVTREIHAHVSVSACVCQELFLCFARHVC